MIQLQSMLIAAVFGTMGLDGDPPPAVSIVTHDAAPAAPMGWWVLPLACGGAGLLIGMAWWWWRQAEALRHDPAGFASRKLLAKEPRAARKALREASKASGVPLLALLMSPTTGERCMADSHSRIG